MRELALLWWSTLTIREKWDLFYENNPLIAAAPANIGLNINMVEPDHIEEIYNKEQIKLLDKAYSKIEEPCRDKYGDIRFNKFDDDDDEIGYRDDYDDNDYYDSFDHY